MAIQVGAVYEVKVFCTTPTDIALNVMHYVPRVESGTPLALEQTVINTFATTFSPLFRALMSNQSDFRNMSLQKIAPPPKEDAWFSPVPAPATPGNIAADLLPRQTCGLITKRTGLAGRSFRGRLYAPYPAESDNSPSGAPTAAYLTALTALADQVRSTVNVGAGVDLWAFDPVVYHRANNTYTFIVDAFRRDYWATQRRRNNNRF